MTWPRWVIHLKRKTMANKTKLIKEPQNLDLQRQNMYDENIGRFDEFAGDAEPEPIPDVEEFGKKKLNGHAARKLMRSLNAEKNKMLPATKLNEVGVNDRPETIVTKQGIGKLVGRDDHAILSEDVRKLAAAGLTNINIADYFDISVGQLVQSFEKQLIQGRVSLSTKLRIKQIEIAMGGNTTMLIFLGKNYLGQSEMSREIITKSPLPWNDDE